MDFKSFLVNLAKCGWFLTVKNTVWHVNTTNSVFYVTTVNIKITKIILPVLSHGNVYCRSALLTWELLKGAWEEIYQATTVVVLVDI